MRLFRGFAQVQRLRGRSTGKYSELRKLIIGTYFRYKIKTKEIL